MIPIVRTQLYHAYVDDEDKEEGLERERRREEKRGK